MRWLLLLLGALNLLSCGGGTTESPTLVGAPTTPGAQRQIVEDAGRRIYAALRRAMPSDILIDDLALRSALEPDAASREAAARATFGSRVTSARDYYRNFENTSYAGVCVQNVRSEPVGGPLGTRNSTWVFDRVLVVASRSEGGRVASWVEGTFVLTSDGFRALDLSSVERPRWEHSDLDLAPCDVSTAASHTQQVVGVTP